MSHNSAKIYGYIFKITRNVFNKKEIMETGQTFDTNITVLNENDGVTDLERSRTDPEALLKTYPEQESSREWISINNLDQFFTNVYNYHYYGGYKPIIYRRFADIIMITFTLIFSIILIAYVDWNLVFKCTEQDPCNSEIFVYRPKQLRLYMYIYTEYF